MDKIGDLLIRIKNGYMASRPEIRVLNSKLSLAILAVLKDERFIGSFKVDGREVVVLLKYNGGESALLGVKRISKPGRRVYSSRSLLPRVLDGVGMALISTPRGVMTDKQARKEGVGGEVMAYVW